MPDLALSNALIAQAETAAGLGTDGITAQRAAPAPAEHPVVAARYPYAVTNLFLFDMAADNMWAQQLRWEIDVYGYGDAASVWQAVANLDAALRGWRVHDTAPEVGISTVLVRVSAQPVEEPLDDKIIRVRAVYTAYYGSIAVADYL